MKKGTVTNAALTFVAEGEPPFFTCLNVSHPDVAIADEADEVGIHWTDFGVHARAGTLALDLERLHGQRLRSATQSEKRGLLTEKTCCNTLEADGLQKVHENERSRQVFEMTKASSHRVYGQEQKHQLKQRVNLEYGNYITRVCLFMSRVKTAKHFNNNNQVKKHILSSSPCTA